MIKSINYYILNISVNDLLNIIKTSKISLKMQNDNLCMCKQISSDGKTINVIMALINTRILNEYFGIRYLNEHDIDVKLIPSDDGLICSYKTRFGINRIIEYVYTDFAIELNTYLLNIK